VYAEVLQFPRALMRAAVSFAFGGCINMAFYGSRRMKAYVADLTRRVPFAATVAYALPMAAYAPSGIPVLFDMQDVDSEKWSEYGRMRRLGFLYRIEATRIRQRELAYAYSSQSTFLTARQEAELFRSLAPAATVECMENGVDSDYFDPELVPHPPELVGRQFVTFVGTMDYFPNVDAASWFAREVFPAIRQQEPAAEFLVVGNNPSKNALALNAIEGVTVTGGVPDVRPYILHARAVVAPLRLARGIQNKVLEALTLGRPVLATGAVCRTFGDEVPAAISRCDTPEDYVAQILPVLALEPQPDPVIRGRMRERFTWKSNVEFFVSRLEDIMSARPDLAMAPMKVLS
jgi:sugar transferase (PEP-CTERM/EpsH1 system associated)